MLRIFAFYFLLTLSILNIRIFFFSLLLVLASYLFAILFFCLLSFPLFLRFFSSSAFSLLRSLFVACSFFLLLFLNFSALFLLYRLLLLASCLHLALYDLFCLSFIFSEIYSKLCSSTQKKQSTSNPRCPILRFSLHIASYFQLSLQTYMLRAQKNSARCGAL